MCIRDRYKYDTVKVTLECEGIAFHASGKTVIDMGWRKYLSGETDETASLLPTLNIGDTFNNSEAQLKEYKTSPPKHYTEDTLLSAMENAVKTDNSERQGLGTPATRAGIIENLVTRGFVERKGKSLIPSDKGNKLISLVPDTLKSADIDVYKRQVKRHRDKPYRLQRKVDRLKYKAEKANRRLLFEKAVHENPQLKRSIRKRTQYKQFIKQKYKQQMRSYAQRKSAKKAAQKTASVIKEFITVKNKGCPILVLIAVLMAFVLCSLFAVTLTSMTGSIVNEYTSSDEEIGLSLIHI